MFIIFTISSPVLAQSFDTKKYETYIRYINYFKFKYAVKVYQETKLPLNIPDLWTVNHFEGSVRKAEKFFELKITGKALISKEASSISFASIVCHELGHILGGSPRQTIPGAEWSSTEGQSDFWAAKTCLPEFFQDVVLDLQSLFYDSSLQQAVFLQFPELLANPKFFPQNYAFCKQNLKCFLVARAGEELINFFDYYDYMDLPKPSLNSHEGDTKEFKPNSYPSLQCRLDTYVRGALCQIEHSCEPPRCWLPL
ncbi:MAG: hypothetical protein L6Q37_09695 [Bdellovibrionaceae bacterium]|nr:hypothetical protein [Pseudobdellovibrionaceae bacterium]